MNKKTNEILNKATEKHSLEKDEIVYLLNFADDNLFKTANEQRKNFVGEEVHLRGLIEFSNICKCNCQYCGLQNQNKNLQRYRLNEKEIIECAKNGAKLGYKTIVLQSGEDSFFNAERIVRIIKEIKKFDVAITLSIGEREFEEYKQFKEAGADRYLIRIETTDENLYKKLHPNMSFENRIRCLKDLRKLNYEVGSGCLVGLPHQTVDSLANDILFFKKMNFDMIGIGPFIKNPDTPLANAQDWTDNFVMSLKVMAITRLLLPDINIPATTAMETLNPNGRIIALQSGANVVMPNITSEKYKKDYKIYPNKICLDEEPQKCRNCISAKITSIGRIVSKDFGFRHHEAKN